MTHIRSNPFFEFLLHDPPLVSCIQEAQAENILTPLSSYESWKLYVRACVCVCVCVSEREKERERDREKGRICFHTCSCVCVSVCVCVCVCVFVVYTVYSWCLLSCHQTQSLDLSREERVDDEDDGLGTTVKVKLLQQERNGQGERDTWNRTMRKVFR